MSETHQQPPASLLHAMFSVAAVDNRITRRERSVIYAVATSKSVGFDKFYVVRELKQYVARIRKSSRQETIAEIVDQISRSSSDTQDETLFMECLEQVAVADGNKGSGEIRLMEQLRQAFNNNAGQESVQGDFLASIQLAGGAPISPRQDKPARGSEGRKGFHQRASRFSSNRQSRNQEARGSKRNKAVSLLCGSLVTFCFFAYLTFQQWQHGKSAETWTAVEARVTAREMRESQTNYDGEQEMDLAWETHVEYIVNGKTYQRIFNKYSARKTMTIYYNPVNPAEATATQGLEWISFLFSFTMLLLSLLGFLIGCTLTIWPHLMSNEA